MLTAVVVPAETLLSLGASHRVTPLTGSSKRDADSRNASQMAQRWRTKRSSKSVQAWRSGGVAEAERVTLAEAPAEILSHDLRDGIASLEQYGLGGANFHGR